MTHSLDLFLADRDARKQRFEESMLRALELLWDRDLSLVTFTCDDKNYKYTLVHHPPAFYYSRNHIMDLAVTAENESCDKHIAALLEFADGGDAVRILSVHVKREKRC